MKVTIEFDNVEEADLALRARSINKQLETIRDLIEKYMFAADPERSDPLPCTDSAYVTLRKIYNKF